MYYFQLFKPNIVGMPESRHARSTVMKVFCRLNAEDLETINEIYSAAVIKMHYEWIEMSKDSSVNIMHFKNAIAKATEFIEQALLKQPMDALQLKQIIFT